VASAFSRASTASWPFSWVSAACWAVSSSPCADASFRNWVGSVESISCIVGSIVSVRYCAAATALSWLNSWLIVVCIWAMPSCRKFTFCCSAWSLPWAVSYWLLAASAANRSAATSALAWLSVGFGAAWALLCAERATTVAAAAVNTDVRVRLTGLGRRCRVTENQVLSHDRTCPGRTAE
jgi:hypothetical protein